MAGRVAADASNLYARNLAAFAGLLANKDRGLAPDYDDDILKAAMLTHAGAIVHPALKG